MKKLQVTDPDGKRRDEIQLEISRTAEARYYHRLHGLLLLTGGNSCLQVSELLGEDRRTVQRWVNQFEKFGLEGLRDQERPGRPKQLGSYVFLSLRRDLSAPPQTFRYPERKWTGKTLSMHLERRYRIRLGVRQCQRVLKLLNNNSGPSTPQVSHLLK